MAQRSRHSAKDRICPWLESTGRLCPACIADLVSEVSNLGRKRPKKWKRKLPVVDNRRRSIRTVSGGLPSLGKRHS
jgi:hypothetical protein